MKINVQHNVLSRAILNENKNEYLLRDGLHAFTCLKIAKDFLFLILFHGFTQSIMMGTDFHYMEPNTLC